VTYKPRSGSLALRLYEHLSRPGAPGSMSAAQIAGTLGASRDSVATNLKHAVECGFFVKTLDGGRALYSLPGRDPADEGEEVDTFGAILDTLDQLTISGGEWIDAGGYRALKLRPEQTARLRRLLTGGGA
jgi:biotin operon repressor